jgi:hypothetical protein
VFSPWGGPWGGLAKAAHYGLHGPYVEESAKSADD